MSFALVSRRAGLGLGRRMVRFESTSTTTKAADTAKNAASEYTAKASEYTAKASEGLSRVTAAAGPAISSAAKGAADALGKVGGRTGRLVAFIERTTPPSIPSCALSIFVVVVVVALVARGGFVEGPVR